MNVRLISYTTPWVLNASGGSMEPEELIVYCARVSSPQNQKNTETAPRLIRYLIEHKHWSPFEMVDLCVEIETSRAIAAQILRHRSFSFQEFSQRYADPTQIGFERYDARRQHPKNRQLSVDDLPDGKKEEFDALQGHVITLCQSAYKKALSLGIAKEVARFLLPMSTGTRLYMKGSVRSWIHYLQVRTAPEVQKEHRDIALEILKIFKGLFPNVAEAVFS